MISEINGVIIDYIFFIVVYDEVEVLVKVKVEYGLMV